LGVCFFLARARQATFGGPLSEMERGSGQEGSSGVEDCGSVGRETEAELDSRTRKAEALPCSGLSACVESYPLK
jgi:hypothetical protein